MKKTRKQRDVYYYVRIYDGVSGKKRSVLYMDGQYRIVDENTFKKGVHLHTRKHPFLFKTEEAAGKFRKWLCEEFVISRFNTSIEFISGYKVPNCMRECWNCNKSEAAKKHCKHLLNLNQNHCGFRMAEFKEGMEFDSERIDASCEKCITYGCPFNMNYER